MPQASIQVRRKQWLQCDKNQDTAKVSAAVASLAPQADKLRRAAQASTVMAELDRLTASQGKYSCDWLDEALSDPETLVSSLLICKLGVGRFQRVDGQRYSKNKLEELLLQHHLVALQSNQKLLAVGGSHAEADDGRRSEGAKARLGASPCTGTRHRRGIRLRGCAFWRALSCARKRC